MITDSYRKIVTKIRIDTKIKTAESRKITKDCSTTDYIALSIASCGGVGYMPIVPATWGSLVGVGIYLLAQKASEYCAIWANTIQISSVLLESLLASFTICFLLALFVIGIWSATRVEKLTGKKDPSLVVIDEVVGQLIAFLFVPAKLGWWTVLAGFITFRIFDIWKPNPTDKFETLPKGLGIMADDAMAGVYAAAFMSLLCSIYLVLL
jgi:phosphatidylglycerophosphatase A